jgi:hypothetical protein
MASRSNSQSFVACSGTSSESNTADGSSSLSSVAYSFIRSLKRNMLTTKGAEDLVLVHNNLRLKHLKLDEPSEA